ncbi:MAG TPA: SDR family oxidoreductase [Nevskiaceae bacterium]|nr:SDR family oxidoreductase [Nevskiaceae bacterium]
MKRVLIIGATSAIAEAVARLCAARGDALLLAARDARKLQTIAADLAVRGAAGVHTLPFDALAGDALAALVEQAARTLGGIDLALIAHGSLPEQAACEQSVELTRREFELNGLSVIVLCTLLAQKLEAQRRGTLAVISSVAGDRGRASNYVYGAAKAAVSAFLSGLRQRLRPAGVQVLTIKPGFVDTPMTAQFAKNALWASPPLVARDILRAVESGQPQLYTPWFWWWIMAIIRAIPERLFARIKL